LFKVCQIGHRTPVTKGVWRAAQTMVRATEYVIQRASTETE
jgi:hypothetical protein